VPNLNTMKTTELTEEEYDALTNGLWEWVRFRVCPYCDGKPTGGAMFKFVPYNQYDGMIKRECSWCGYTELFNPEIAKRFM